MTRRLISSGSPFEAKAGYSRAVVDGRWVFVSGTTGYDYRTMTMPDDVVDQARNALETIRAALADAEASMDDVVRARYYLVDPDDAERVFEVLGSVFGEIRPAATMVVCDLIRPEMKVEIEVTARRKISRPDD
ncbi:RidA family protein [Amorphus coralli]|uniref:RidA family protein n=1 Tax=Amorphus coralli TaxID=340680 RepID=UPI00036F6F09|nr:RidA family protein [Amorphus coralli]